MRGAARRDRPPASAAAADRRVEAWLGPVRRHVTAYRFCWGLALVGFLIAWNRGIAMLYAVAALTLAALALSHLLAWSSLRGVSVRRGRIGRLAAGEVPALRYRIDVPARRHFLLLYEPALAPVAPTLVAELGTGATRERTLPGLCRGVYRLGSLELATAYPFGLHETRRVLAQPAQELVVHPRWHACALPAPRPARARRVTSETVASRARGWDEFAGVREHRPGEGVKHVHWRASARREQLLVKEYDALDTPGMLIVLPQQPGFDRGPAPASCFEYAIELAVSLARAATRAGYPVEVANVGRAVGRWRLAPHTAELSPTLDWFARLRPEGTTPLAVALARAGATRGDSGWLATFRHAGDPLPALLSPGLHLDFVFAAGEFDPARETADAAPGTAPGLGREATASGFRYRITRETDLGRLLV